MILLDTNVIIDIGRGRTEAKKHIQKYGAETFALSAVTIEEMYVGLGYILQKYGKKLFEANKEKTLKLLNDYEILNITQPILERSGMMRGELRAKGITIGIQDLIIGATAEISSAEKLITRNPDHFKMFKISIESYKIKTSYSKN